MIEILNEISAEKPYLVVNKKSNFPSAPLSPEDKNNAFDLAAQKFPQLLNVHGKKEIEHGLLHRLDNVTEGLLLIAATQEFYDFMSEQQSQNQFTKTYHAQCKINKQNTVLLGGFPPPPAIQLKKGAEFIVTSMFRPFSKGGKQVRPVTKECGEAALKKVGKQVEYTTKVKILEIHNDIIEVECRLTRGFRHQIRCHLAWLGMPIVNDPIYNCECKEMENENQIRFIATGLDFYYPKGDLNSYVRKYTWT